MIFVPEIKVNVIAISTSKTSLVRFKVEVTAAKAVAALPPPSTEFVYSAEVDIAILNVLKVWSFASRVEDAFIYEKILSSSVEQLNDFEGPRLAFLV